MPTGYPCHFPSFEKFSRQEFQVQQYSKLEFCSYVFLVVIFNLLQNTLLQALDCMVLINTIINHTIGREPKGKQTLQFKYSKKKKINKKEIGFCFHKFLQGIGGTAEWHRLLSIARTSVQPKCLLRRATGRLVSCNPWSKVTKFAMFLSY